MVETINARLIENDEVSESETPFNAKIQEVEVKIHLPSTSFKVVYQIVEQFNYYQE
jgi:hypothetical protein